MASELTESVVSNELPTLEGMLIACNRTIQKLEKGETTPAMANAQVNTIGTVVRIVKLELEAAKSLNRVPTMLPRMLPMPPQVVEHETGKAAQQ